MLSVELEKLKDVYHYREDRIKSMCKAISQTLQTKIFVSVARNGAVRFEIVGRKIKQASRYIEEEFCIKVSLCRVCALTGLILINIPC